MKKLFKSIMAGTLVVCSSLCLVACEKPKDPPAHVHNYEGEIYYTVENGKAYTAQDCDCGEANKTEVANSIVVTNVETAANYYQKVLDGDVNGKTIVFAPGEYTSEILIRPSAATVDKIYGNFNREIDQNTLLNITPTGAEIELEDFLESDDLTSEAHTYKNMVYERTISNLTLVGAKGAEFKNQLRITEVEDAYTGNLVFDAVRGENLPTDSEHDYKYASLFNIDGLTISNMDFVGKKGNIRYYSYPVKGTTNVEPGYIKNFKLQNCTFINEEADNNQPYGALRFFTASNNFENFEITNNVVKNHYQGFLVQNAKNITIENNKISGTEHNAIAVQSNNASTYVSGNIKILNNEISDTTDRAIRMNLLKNATITVSGNSFANAGEVNGAYKEILKTGAFVEADNVEYSFTNNTYEGSATGFISEKDNKNCLIIKVAVTPAE